MMKLQDMFYGLKQRNSLFRIFMQAFKFKKSISRILVPLFDDFLGSKTLIIYRLGLPVSTNLIYVVYHEVVGHEDRKVLNYLKFLSYCYLKNKLGRFRPRVLRPRVLRPRAICHCVLRPCVPHPCVLRSRVLRSRVPDLVYSALVSYNLSCIL